METKRKKKQDKQVSSNGIPVILPILIENVQLPLFLKDIRCANFSIDYQGGLMELLDSIKNPDPA